MAGGVGCVEFADKAEHDDWDMEETPDGRVLYFPVVGSDLEKEMNALPVVSEAELFGILNLQPKRTKDNLPLPMTFGNTTPIIFRYKDYWYVDAPYKSNDSNVVLIDEHYFNSQKRLAISDHIQK